MGRILGLYNIGEWYVTLWQHHGLTVPHGLLIVPGRVSITQARNCFERGKRYRADIPEDVDELQVGWALQTWRRKRGTAPENGQRALRECLECAIDDGYWLNYLEGVIGQSAADFPSNFITGGDK